MKTKIIYPTLFLFGVLLSGCGIPSVHPLYEPEDLIQHKELTGVWSSDDEEELFYVFSYNDFINNRTMLPEKLLTTGDDTTSNFTITLDDLKIDLTEETEEGKKNLYYIIQSINGKPEEIFFAGLVVLDSQYFIDLYKTRTDEDGFRFPTHIFTKLEIQEDKLMLQEFKESFVKDLIKNQQIRIKHEYADDNFLLTAPSEDLKKFILKYGRESEAYGEKYTYERVKDTL
jgi:hypothetical protein